MNRRANLYIIVSLVIFLALGALQGRRLDHIREAEAFFRWIISSANSVGIGEVLEFSSETDVEMMDDELFRSVAAEAAPHLPEIEAEDESLESKSKLVRHVMAFIAEDASAAEAAVEEQVWEMARGPVLSEQRRQFKEYIQSEQLSPVVTELSHAQLYQQDRAYVGLTNIFFGFRKMAANLLWLQVDKYWHQGMMHRMVPLMRLCVALDPQFVDAYLIGAWHLAYNATAKLPDTPWRLRQYDEELEAFVGEKERYYYQAIDFLKDGIRKNPRNYKLYFDLGFGIFEEKLKDHDKAVFYLKQAIRHKHDRWVPRQLYLCMQYAGKYEEAIAGWNDYMQKFPDYKLGERLRDTSRGLLAERKYEEANEKARAAEAEARTALKGNDQVAAVEAQARARELRNQADNLKAKAIAIYEHINEITPRGDPFSTGRIKRLEALDLVEQGRYDEAIALLDYARWESNDLWDELSDLIIEIKQKAGISLSVSEQEYVVRREEEQAVKAAALEMQE